jgi:hypothetical protein
MTIGPCRAENSTDTLISECEDFERSVRVNGRYATWQGNGGVCFGFFWAMIEMIDGKECVPDGITTTQLIKMFLFHAKANPAWLHLPASRVALSSIANAYPCQK